MRAGGSGALFFQVLVAVLAAGLFAGTLGSGFTFDDPQIVVENPLVAGDGGPWRIFTTHYWSGDYAEGSLYRPLTVLTYWVNRRALGPGPAGFHLVNVLLHAAVSLVLFRLARRLTGSVPAAAAAALLFAAHPVHTEAVANIVGRAELLAALFVLGAWLLRGRPLLSAALFAMGLLSKENAIVLPGLMLLEDLLGPAPEGGRRVRPLGYLPWVAVAAGFLLLRWAVIGEAIGPPDGPFAQVSDPVRLMTAVAALGRYLWLLVWPLHLSADYSYDQIPLVTSPLDPRLAAGLAGVALLGALAWIWRRRRPAASMGLLWVLVGLSPVSNILFGIGVILAERLLYLPSAGFCLGAGVLLSDLAARLSPRRATAAACLLAALPVSLYGARTWTRNRDWFDQLSLFEATVRTSPRSALARVNLGTIYQSLGRVEEAEREYLEAAKIAPDRPGPYYNLATLYEAMGRGAEAMANYREALRVDPGDHLSMNNLGRLLLQEGRVAEAIPVLERAVEMNPDGPVPAVNLAAAWLRAGEVEKARSLVSRVLDSHPGEPAAMRLMEAIRRGRD